MNKFVTQIGNRISDITNRISVNPWSSAMFREVSIEPLPFLKRAGTSDILILPMAQ
ncbi:hypothetical protein L6773_10725 [Rhodohalobacter sp. WB101]|uniref:Uncharacterized protein n=1 Tax=Rhodohalobacter sulfatireducens TaxID=2911366 RepID=A0ABS9KDV7_9BACT|nr:hypothetical protein [Rhodohalobacter sulfatireducens]